MCEPLVVKSHRGSYTAHFEDCAFAALNAADHAGTHFIIDRRVAELYRDELGNVLASRSVLRIEATEANKTLEQIPLYVNALVSRSIRRKHSLVAVGGGIMQDITCFLAATLLRGIEWRFYPTTLLAQADSCIGSKSSINCGNAKNILGTFTPPASIHISTRVLQTLEVKDVRSGLGEMLKVHAIDSPESFDRIAGDCEKLLADPAMMMHYIRASLEIKRRIIEADEFDQGVRNVMNYGHTFGHAIEAATNFQVPHGIAVTIGMDMANFVAAGLNRTTREVYDRMHPVLRWNYAGFESVGIPLQVFTQALAKDKKHTDTDLAVVLPDREGWISPTLKAGDTTFWGLCAEYLAGARRR